MAEQARERNERIRAELMYQKENLHLLNTKKFEGREHRNSYDVNQFTKLQEEEKRRKN